MDNIETNHSWISIQLRIYYQTYNQYTALIYQQRYQKSQETRKKNRELKLKIKQIKLENINNNSNNNKNEDS